MVHIILYWTSILQKIYKLLTTTLFDDRLCPRCGQHIPISSSFVKHYTAVHCSSTTMFNTVLLDLRSGSFLLDLLHHIRTCLTTHCLTGHLFFFSISAFSAFWFLYNNYYFCCFLCMYLLYLYNYILYSEGKYQISNIKYTVVVSCVCVCVYVCACVRACVRACVGLSVCLSVSTRYSGSTRD